MPLNTLTRYLKYWRKPINRAGHSLIMDEPFFSNAGRRPPTARSEQPDQSAAGLVKQCRLRPAPRHHVRTPVCCAPRTRLRCWENATTRKMAPLALSAVGVCLGRTSQESTWMHALVHGTCPPSRPSERLTVEFGSARTYRSPEPAIACSPCHRLSRG